MLPVAPSAIKPNGQAFIENENGQGEMVPFVTPRALQIDEIPYVIQQYVRAARNALGAGFEGIEIHAANGYLLDQFINSSTNRRTDQYGGRIENRARLLMEAVEALAEVWAPQGIGVRLSPLGRLNDIEDENPDETFGYICEKLSEYRLAYLHRVNPAIGALEKKTDPEPRSMRMIELVREKYDGIADRCRWV
jgi:N-ethylmaleimide reductase